MDLARLPAGWHEINVTIGHGDFGSERTSVLEIPPNGDILTSRSFHHIRDSALALRNILNRKPLRVYQCEPTLQHHRDETILGLLQRTYRQVSDYNSSLRGEMGGLSDEGIIELHSEDAVAFGANFSLPAPEIAWRPTS